MENPFFSLLTCIVTLCGLVSPSQESQAKPATNSPLKHTHAYITAVTNQSAQRAKVSLDFVGVFYDGKDEYQRYLNAGYPKISFSEFESATAGGMASFNQRRKIRNFHTHADTVYEAYCLDSPLKNAEGLVRLSQQEFLAVLDKNNVSKSVWQDFRNKHGYCISQNQELVEVTYDAANQQIKTLKTVWTP